MSEISAAAVMSLRKKTGLPMMDCKSALAEANGDENLAVELLRKKGEAVAIKRADRETGFGRFGLCIGADRAAGAIVELLCESAPVAGNDEFIQLANDLAQVYADDASIADAEALLDQASPSKPGQTLRQVKDDMFNRIREVFRVGRMARIDGPTGGYSHNSGTVAGVLLGITGGSDELAKDVSMHVAAMRPTALNVADLDATAVAKEREILREAALQEGKPENIVDKMVEGRMRNYYAEQVLLEQPFVKDDKQTVGKFAQAAGMTIHKFVHWELGR
ncbi:MAG: translation elongation factor Ts [Pirellulaceae bacterium]|nr:translation elongation factor Ts [Planctomycetales bacterium]